MLNSLIIARMEGDAAEKLSALNHLALSDSHTDHRRDSSSGAAVQSIEEAYKLPRRAQDLPFRPPNSCNQSGQALRNRPVLLSTDLVAPGAGDALAGIYFLVSLHPLLLLSELLWFTTVQ